MTNKNYYIVSFEDNAIFKTWGYFFLNSKCINKEGPFSSENEAATISLKYNRACIVYNAYNQSFLNDQRHTAFTDDAIHNLVTWAKKNIGIVSRKNSIVDVMETIPENSVEQEVSE